jgi:hypothetical protein
MDFLLRLSKEQAKSKIARQRRYRRWFWIVGAFLLVIQGTLAVYISQTEPATAALSQTPSTTTTLRELAFQPTVTHTAEPTMPISRSATRTAKPTRPVLRTATPKSTLPTPTLLPTSTPTPAPERTISLDATKAMLSTGYGAHKGSSTPSAARSRQIILLSPPKRVIEQTFELAGTAQPNKTIAIYYDHSTIAQVESDKKGYWQVQIPTSPLLRGNNTFRISDTLNTSLSLQVTFAPWWLDAPMRLQASLGEGYACAPTVLGMALDYYHHQDDRYPAPATTELVQALTKEGFISGYGADAQMLCDLAIAYGYSHSFFYQEWSQAHVRQMLDAGHPIIANVRVGLSTEGYGHSVLVIGLSPDGKRIMLNDPAQGMVETSWKQFDRSWASFGPPYRHGTVVIP